MLTELMLKLAEGKHLDSLEISNLRRELQAVEEVKNLAKTWVVPGTQTPIFQPPISVIYSKVLEADTASLTIKIPSEYKHLMVMGQGRVNGSGGQLLVNVYARYNDDTGSNYQWGSMTQTGTSLSGIEDLSDIYNIFFAFTADGEATNSYAGASIIFIPNYNSSWYKMQLSFRGNSLSTATSNSLRHSVWRDTNPIRSITIFPDPTYASAKLVAGTIVSVYGVL